MKLAASQMPAGAAAAIGKRSFHTSGVMMSETVCEPAPARPPSRRLQLETTTPLESGRPVRAFPTPR
jgi:hypothetical protein